ncbi:peptidase S9 [Halioglobus sp. HI00S01]|uniref:S9 family peptidase n=1 Tax=Halioglobus sp. HI00S01 TaxID=1822214 RepID=UPI0007C22C57|nr:S9 family peptidase [Halioglobus sp. HI00S01]KZX57068.1 peptidase S9 [Halioglobus sp. HI00S01]
MSIRMRILGIVCLLPLVVGGCATPPAEEQVALIERSQLFGNPSRFQGRLSPDGTLMSFRAPLDGVMNIWVAPVGDFEAAKPVTRDTGRGVPSHFWALDSVHLLYIQDRDGDENWHMYRVNVGTGEMADLTPYDGVRAVNLGQSERHPGNIVIGMNDRDPRWHDAYLVDLASAERTLLAENEGFISLLVDNNLEVRGALAPTDEGGATVLRRSGDEWLPVLDIPVEDYRTSSVLGFDADNKHIYMLDSRNRDKAALVRVDFATGKTRPIAHSDQADIGSVLMDPRTHKPVAVGVRVHELKWTALDPAFEADFAALAEQAIGDAEILATTLDASRWIIYQSRADGSPVYAVYDRSTRALDTMFVTNPDLEGLPLSPVHNLTIPSRDGLDLVSYLTVPRGVQVDAEGMPSQPGPMVLLVHGGPWARDMAGYSGEVQFLANRGYAVLQVNYRGSSGFGKAFINAGDKQWAANMHNDLVDAVAWAVDAGVADPDSVAIMGTSYGGYATLVGLTFTPELFACGVDVVGPSNLETLIASIPPYWTSFLRSLINALGDPDTEEGLALLKDRSPVNRVDQIRRPLLIGQGANDPRVKQAESDQIVEAMQARNIPVTYALYPDEGHGFQKPENTISFYALADGFLSECLGGRHQPIGDDLQGSSLQVLEGVEGVPGLAEALEAAERR